MSWLAGVKNTAALKQILYSLEIQSEHPLAEAVINHLKKDEVTAAQVTSFESITARGVTGVAGSERYYVGNKQLIDENQLPIDQELLQQAELLQQRANTVIYFANQQQVLAIIAIADKIKSTSAKAVRQLMNMGIEVYMLTGDNEQTAAAVAAATGITHFAAGMQPAGKAGFVKQLQQQNKVVAMVGDGINDSHALAQADVSIAMGKGSDIAMDVAKMTLITSDLQSIPKALVLSRKTVRTIRQNLFWAFIYNLIGIPLAAGVLYAFNGFLLNPMIAGAAMALSSVSVVTNSLRLKSIKL
jgi:Cu2+-exporting ATPase